MRLRRLLGTERLVRLLRDQVGLLKDQNRAATRAAERAERSTALQADALRSLAKQQARLEERADKQLAQMHKSYEAAKRSVELQNRQLKRLEQLVASLFEANRTLYQSYKGEGFALGGSGASFFSQNGEDGILLEIARRIDCRIESFVEIGAGEGRENNTLQLLFAGARGIWVEADDASVSEIRALHQGLIEQGALIVVPARVTAENVNSLLREAGSPAIVDFLSIDIDGNDYWVWQALDAVAPKILCMEYNAVFGPSAGWVMRYDPDYVWPGGTIYYGASLKALERLSKRKGYSLVACDYSGTNAFFLRDDLINERFQGPFTAEAQFQPYRGALGRWPRTKEVAFGPFESV